MKHKSKPIDFDYLEFLAWVDRCIFPVNLARDFRKLGMDKPTWVMCEMTFKEKQRNGKFEIIRLYQAYCVGSRTKVTKGTIGYYLKLWLADMYRKWSSYKQRGQVDENSM